MEIKINGILLTVNTNRLFVTLKSIVLFESKNFSIKSERVGALQRVLGSVLLNLCTIK